MKNKIFVIFILIALVLPATSRAFRLVLTANLTIVVNTQEEDNSFHFDVQSNGGGPVFSDYQQFDMPTEGLTASQSASLVVFGNQYSLSQSNTSGLRIDSVNCVSDNPSDVFSYKANGVIFSPTVNENIICTFNNVKTKTPVLIVPGLLGTEIGGESNTLWPNIIAMATSSSDNFMDPLEFNSDLSSTDNALQLGDVIKEIGIPVKPFNYDYTDGLIKEFTNQGYVENQNLFTFPYDWRYGASGKYPDGLTNSDLLAQKIQDILTQTGASKIDIVAHSLGGLVVKQYAMDHPTDNNIDKAVFVGVPELGSLKSLKVLLQGDDFDISFAGLGLSQSEIKKISANMPAAYDLLPDQQYYDAKGSFVTVVQKGVSGNFSTTQQDLNYQDFGNYLTSDHGLNSQGLANAISLHGADFDNFDMRTAGVDVYAIDGCKTGTLDKIVEDRQGSSLGETIADYKNVSFKDGDNTVPIESSSNLPMDDDHRFYLLSAKHSSMLVQDGSKQEIVNLISGSNLNVDSKFITQDVTKCGLNGKVISKHSPINILATDQDGNQSGITADGSMVNDIPNADYEAFGDQGYLYLPTDDGQTYNITMQGTDTGTYTIDSQDVVDDAVSNTQVFSDLPVTPALTGQINLGGVGQPTTLTVQQTPSSSSQTIAADATLSDSAPEDFLPPVSVATVNGAQDSNGNYTGNVDADIKAADENSGVLNVEYDLDNAGFQKVAGDSVDVPVSGSGAHTVSFFSTDNAGNNEEAQTINFAIATPVPVAPVVVSASVSEASSGGASCSAAGSSSCLVGGGGPIMMLQNQNNQSVKAAPTPSPAVSQNNSLVAAVNPAPITLKTAPNITPVSVKVLQTPAKQTVVKSNSGPAIVAVNNTVPVVVSVNRNSFLGSLSDMGFWIIKWLFGK